MKDEEYMFYSDCREKKNIAHSARNRRTHNGKGGRVQFPSDNMSKKELNAMNGKVESYRLNEPMTWQEFKGMPDDLKVFYVKLLRQKYNAPDIAIGNMMGADKDQISRMFIKLGLRDGMGRGKRTGWDKEGFMAWRLGVSVANPAEECDEKVEHPVVETQEPVVETQEPVIEEICVEKTEPIPEVKHKAIPNTGSMVFEGKVEDILNTISVLLGGENVHINVTWDVLSEGD